MLELRDAELELVELVARDEIELVDERPNGADRGLRQTRSTAAQPGRKLDHELFEDLGQPLAIALGHAASSDDAGGASRGSPATQATTARTGSRRRARASAPRRAPARTGAARCLPRPAR